MSEINNFVLKKATFQDDDAETILSKFELTDIPINIIDLAHKFEFKIIEMTLAEDITGLLMVNDCEKVLGSDANRVIIVNSNLSDDKMRLVIAHELCHFLQSYKGNKKNILSFRDRNSLDTDSEKETDHLARCLLVPYHSLIKYLESTFGIKDCIDTKDLPRIIEKISDHFWITQQKARMRIEDLFHLIEDSDEKIQAIF